MIKLHGMKNINITVYCKEPADLSYGIDTDGTRSSVIGNTNMSSHSLSPLQSRSYFARVVVLEAEGHVQT
jgi:hypothetical protein